MDQDIDKDLHHFHSLYRIGLTDKNITKQLSFLFLILFSLRLYMPNLHLKHCRTCSHHLFEYLVPNGRNVLLIIIRTIHRIDYRSLSQSTVTLIGMEGGDSCGNSMSLETPECEAHGGSSHARGKRPRSEERRVGKECIYNESPIHEKEERQ